MDTQVVNSQLMTNNEPKAILNLYKIYKLKYCGRACHHEEDETLENQNHEDNNQSSLAQEMESKESETVDIILTNENITLPNKEINQYKLLKKKYVSAGCHEQTESNSETRTIQQSSLEESNNDAAVAAPDLTNESLYFELKQNEVGNKKTSKKSANEGMDNTSDCVSNATRRSRRIFLISQKENHKPLTKLTAKRINYRKKESIKEKIDCNLQDKSQPPQTAANKVGKKYSCLFCTSYFSHNSVLGRHMKKSHRDDTFNCDICSKKYLSYGRLNQHKKRSHAIVDGKYKCLKCTFKFNSLIGLGRHLSLCHKNEDLKCEECGHKFQRYKILAQHIKRRHTDHPCSKCNKNFETEVLLRNHDMRRHTYGQKKKLLTRRFLAPYSRNCPKYDWYQCFMCDKKMNDKSHLKKHIINVELKLKGREKCRICKARYHTKSQLKLHRMKH